MQYGSLIHAWFEQLAWLPPPPGDAVRGDAVPGDAAPGKGMAESAETPLSDGQLRRIATALELENVDVGRAIRDFRHMLGNATIRALLDRERYAAELLARLPKRVREQAWGTAAVTVQGDASRQWPAGLELQVRNEQPVVTKLDGQIMAGTIDRLVLIRRDQNLLAADILDYKTDAIDPRDTASWAAKIDFYRPQLLAYRRAVSKMLRLDLPSVSARLLFVGNGQLATVAEWGSED
jgi:ATP-dependent exoDNAse (exonuclease V) beta subunit